MRRSLRIAIAEGLGFVAMPAFGQFESCLLFGKGGRASPSPDLHQHRSGFIVKGKEKREKAKMKGM
jgi:hypothetical protein